MPVIISGEDLNEVYVKLLDKVIYEGDSLTDERGDEIREILNVVTNIRNPFGDNDFNVIEPIKIIRGFPMGRDEFETYKKQFLNPVNQGFVYTYGERLRSYPIKTGRIFGESTIFVDQIHEIIEKLNQNNCTRRATAVTWMPYVDNKNEDVPCLIMIDFKIRNGKLYENIVYRSHDSLLGWYPNLVGLTHVAEYVLSHLHDDITMGEITVLSISAHIRMNDMNFAQEILDKNQHLLK